MKRLLTVLFGLSMMACDSGEDSNIEDESNALIVSATIEGATSVHIDESSKRVFAFYDELSFPATVSSSFEVSEGASLSPTNGSSLSFDDQEDFNTITVTSYDGSNESSYQLILADPQLSNSAFENWYDATGTGGQSFKEPGKHLESTIWSTANMGTSIYQEYGTTPFQVEGNTAAKIETIKAGLIPVASGTLFNGTFDINGAISNPTDPTAAVNFGIPFIYSPKSIKFKYSYVPGETLIQGSLKDEGNIFGGFDIEELNGTDEWSLEAVLEKRDGDMIIQIATAAHFSSETVDNLTEISIDLDYDNSETPTHFHLVFASSAYGDEYKGAVGSTLIIDDIELVYE